MSTPFARYNRQVLLPFIGEEGQKKICASTAVVIGCGALGTVIANVLARAGVGHLKIIDRDFIEESNLQRQLLFDEDDCRDNLPKAAAAERKLKQVNSTIQVEGIVSDVNPTNIEEFIKGATVVVDGADNFETRFVLNDACVKHGLPWIYGAAVGSVGLSMTVIPGTTPCLRCIFETAPPPGMTPTCDTAGVLASVTGLIGNYEAAEALKICAGLTQHVNTKLFQIDLWTGEQHAFKIARAREVADCPCCKRRNFEFLEGQGASSTTSLCGRNAVQINPKNGAKVNIEDLAKQLKNSSDVKNLSANKFLLKFNAPGGDEGLEITVFPDARAIVKGTKQIPVARTAYAKYVGA
ncbi:MAG: ThiF family adenylyltransferase [Planctomycetota bacterium]|nr:ThiF family adenylyltransferase [Planctomycetota bacterium]